MDVVVGKIAFRGAEGVAVAVDFKGADLGKTEETPFGMVVIAVLVAVAGGQGVGSVAGEIVRQLHFLQHPTAGVKDIGVCHFIVQHNAAAQGVGDGF